MSNETNSPRYSMVVWHDAKKGRVMLSCAGPANEPEEASLEVRSIGAGVFTWSPRKGYPVQVEVEESPGKYSNRSRHFRIRGANGVPIFCANPSQHPNGYNAGKRSFMICGDVEFSITLSDKGPLINESFPDEYVVLKVVGDNPDLLNTRRLVVPFVGSDGSVLKLDCCDIDGGNRMVAGFPLNERIEKETPIRVGHGRFVFVTGVEASTGEFDFHVTPDVGVEMFRVLPLRHWNRVPRIGDFRVRAKALADRPGTMSVSLDLTTISSYADAPGERNFEE